MTSTFTAEEARDFLAHSGVKGMRWGVRSSHDSVKYRLAKNGGSKKKAIAKSIGQTLAADLLTSAAAKITIDQLRDPRAKLAVAAGALAIKGLNTAVGVVEVRRLASATDED